MSRILNAYNPNLWWLELEESRAMPAGIIKYYTVRLYTKNKLISKSVNRSEKQ